MINNLDIRMAILPASSLTWIPEDDLLLKNAVEAGASLEALAKGAIQFSRKFTIQELQDRWHSLLYDPDVSAEASARMFELQLSASNVTPKFSSSGSTSETAEGSSKRKFESIRSLYHAMRKKTRSRPSNSYSLDVLGSSVANACLDYGSGFQECLGPHNDSVIRDIIQNQFSLQDIGVDILCDPPQYSSLQPGLPLWKSVEDISAPMMSSGMMGENAGQGVEEKMINPDDMDGEKINPSGYDSHPEVLQCSHKGELNSLNALSESDLADISNSLLNFTNEGELSCLDANGKETKDNSSYISFDSLLLTSNNVHEDNAHNVKDTQVSVSETCLAHSDDAFPAELVVSDQNSLSDNGDQHPVHQLEDKTLSISALNFFSPEPYNGEMWCTLNTEDPEIPCNDHVIFDETCSSLALPSHKEGSVPTSSVTSEKDKPERMMKKEDDPTDVFDVSPMVDSKIVLQTSLNNPFATDGVKCEVDGDKFVSLMGNASNAIVDPSKFPYSAASEAWEECPLNECNSTHGTLHGKASSASNKTLEAAENPSSLHPEESDSDDSIPSFSDIEAMILEMDLFPEDSDPCIRRKVARYQNEDAKRTIIRLEQSAQSSMKRAIASQGALAILYGCHSKHYIRKSEVILGRATNDFDVDIDLGKEGRPNKISRRQAIIKMDDKGSFFLKNLSKILVCVNDKEVNNGEITPLTNNCLIEIRGMGFVFETNQKSVKRYLERDKQAKNTKFEWSQQES